MTGEVIQEFLVGLGFDVDENSLAKFNKSIASAAVRVTALVTTIQASAAGIFYAISGISQSFEDMGYQLRIVQPAMNRWLVMRQAMLSAYAHAGVNLTQAVKQSILFNYSLAKTKFALEAVYKSVGLKFLPMLTKQMDIFRSKIFANMPKIQATLQKFVAFIFKAFQATVELGTRLWSILGRLWDFFEKLDTATNGWSTRILAFVAAWKLLNLEFIATPIGAILTGLLAILALFDDFKVWQEGGKSLFDWSSFVPIINSVGRTFSTIGEILGEVTATVYDLIDGIIKLFHLDFKGWLQSWGAAVNAVADTIMSLGTLFSNLVGNLSAIIGWLPTAGGALAHLLGGAGPVIGQTQAPRPLVGAPNANNQNVSQQTSIVVNGSADATTVGKTVASQQDRVNFDMTRNLKGAMQ